MSPARSSVHWGMWSWDLPWNDAHETLAHDAGTGLTDHAERPGAEYVAAGAKAAEDRAVALGTAPQHCNLDWTTRHAACSGMNVPCTKLMCSCLDTACYEINRQTGVSGEQLLAPSAAAVSVWPALVDACLWSRDRRHTTCMTAHARDLFWKTWRRISLLVWCQGPRPGEAATCCRLKRRRAKSSIPTPPPRRRWPTDLYPAILSVLSSVPPYRHFILAHLFHLSCFRMQPSQPPASITTTG